MVVVRQMLSDKGEGEVYVVYSVLEVLRMVMVNGKRLLHSLLFQSYPEG